jgi:formiminotetrahydrofolate cyclodeaminase
MPFADLTLREFVASLASSAPVPGGGAASAVTASLGAALVSMVAELSVGNAASAVHRETQVAAGAAARDLAARFLDLADADAGAFAGFGEATKLPRSTDEEKAARASAIRAAARMAAEAPLAVMEAALELARAAETLAGRSNPNLASDIVVAAHLAEAASAGAAANVRVNLPLVKDPAWEAATARRVDRLLAGTALLAGAARYAVAAGVARHPVGVPGGPEGEGAAPTESLEAVR